jgi:hypothetical protein
VLTGDSVAIAKEVGKELGIGGNIAPSATLEVRTLLCVFNSFFSAFFSAFFFLCLCLSENGKYQRFGHLGTG